MLCCATFMSGCASNQPANTADNAPLIITPNVSVGGSSNSAASMYQLGRYYQGQNRYDQAIAAYKKSLAADAGYAEAHNGLGVIYSKMGRYDDAIVEFTAALEKSPQAAHIYNNLGYAHYLQGQYGESISALKQALVLDPNNKRALENLNLANAKAGHADNPAQVVDAAEARPEVSAAAGNVQDLWELKSDKKKGSAQEDSGQIVRATESRVEVVQIAPAVYQLQKRVPAQPIYNEMQFSRKIGIEVANGNGVTGMARKVGTFLRHEGYPAARLTNQKPFKVMSSQVQYRAGYQQAAEQLKASLPGQPTLAQRDDLRSGTNLRLVLGKDLVDDQAFFNNK